MNNLEIKNPKKLTYNNETNYQKCESSNNLNIVLRDHLIHNEELNHIKESIIYENNNDIENEFNIKNSIESSLKPIVNLNNPLNLLDRIDLLKVIH